MNVRQAIKILKQDRPRETHPKNRVWWNRYNRAFNYTQKLYNHKFSKIRKERNGVQLLSECEVDNIIDEIKSKTY